MTNSILLFTFSPVQSFIAEARRAEDLFNGSTILVELAKAAADSFGENSLIYPADLKNGDIPNILTVKVPIDAAKDKADTAKDALMKRWWQIAEDARNKAKLPQDDDWQAIWKRQIYDTPPWQVFWAAAEMKDEKDYTNAYREARKKLDAIKLSRIFGQIDEPGSKDSLSGQREALHTNNLKPKAYWADAAKKNMQSRLRSEGKERLDSIGLVKRFAELRKDSIPSTSTVAAWDFYEKAKKSASMELAAYKVAVEMFSEAHKPGIYQPHQKDSTWPFDGDLFFKETLTRERMKDSYQLDVLDEDLSGLQKLLKKLREKVGESPSPYYAIIVLDGDGMGQHLDDLLNAANPEQVHRDLSANLAKFSQDAQTLVKAENGGFMVYNGGDDVVCLASREKAIGLAHQLAEKFKEKTSCTASAGITIVHHLTPLGLALDDARKAEKTAKEFKTADGKKNAVCVKLLKRSGNPLDARSAWGNLEIFEEMLQLMKDGQKISSRLPYVFAREAPTLVALPDDGQKAGLKFILNRQANLGDETDEIMKKLHLWAEQINTRQKTTSAGLSEVASWLILARFLASGGGE